MWFFQTLDVLLMNFSSHQKCRFVFDYIIILYINIHRVNPRQSWWLDRINFVGSSKLFKQCHRYTVRINLPPHDKSIQVPAIALWWAVGSKYGATTSPSGRRLDWQKPRLNIDFKLWNIRFLGCPSVFGQKARHVLISALKKASNSKT
jgi:hypothetical protein